MSYDLFNCQKGLCFLRDNSTGDMMYLEGSSLKHSAK